MVHPDWQKGTPTRPPTKKKDPNPTNPPPKKKSK